jgi:hypothetical protein
MFSYDLRMPLNQEETIRELARLRHVQRDLPSSARPALDPTLDLLRSSVPPSVKKSVAARVFGVSQNALERWLRSGEIATVRTPSGRTEVSVSELLDLLEQMTELGDLSRPLAAAVRRRRDRSSRTMNVDLLPWSPEGEPDDHRRADLRALAYHRAVGKQLTPAMVDAARRRLERWRTDGRIHPVWADEWTKLLLEPLDRIREVIGEDSSHAADLRQSSPFAGALSDHERRQILRAVDATTS